MFEFGENSRVKQVEKVFTVLTLNCGLFSPRFHLMWTDHKWFSMLSGMLFIHKIGWNGTVFELR